MGHESAAAYNGKQTKKKLEEDRFDAVFLDLRLGMEDGLEVFDTIREEGHEMPVIMFTAYSSIETAILATRKGIFDYIQKPFVPEQIRQTLKKLEENFKLKNRIQDLESRLSETDSTHSFESDEPVMQHVFEVANKAAQS
jgi:two-component system, NtrC family, response regulator AlgB